MSTDGTADGSDPVEPVEPVDSDGTLAPEARAAQSDLNLADRLRPVQPDPSEPPDPTLMRNQAALTTSPGTIWLVVGGILTVVSLVVLVPMIQLPPPGVGAGGAIAVTLLYAAMLIIRYAVPPGRLRLFALAGAFLLIATIALVVALIVADSAARLAQ